MISVLIPVYNYDIVCLVGELHRQLIELKIEFEIICWDDDSKNTFQKSNQKIEIKENLTYYSSKKNIGRTSTRQLLAEKAKFDWLLFLDADVLPKSNSFIKTYLKFVDQDYRAVYGGITYDKQKPGPEFALRWTYGSMKEVVKAKTRNKKPFKHTVSANFLIYKSIFLELNGNIEQSGYGYDNYFGALLKENNINLLHIDNEVVHLGLESNEKYLSKIESGVETLYFLYKNKKLIETENSLLKAFLNLKSIGMGHLTARLFDIMNSKLKRDLLSDNPSIWKLQLYKLGYICLLDSKQ